MSDRNVALLDSGSVYRRNNNCYIDTFCEHPTIFACESDGFKSLFPGCLNGGDDIGRITTGADTNGYVIRPTQALDLPRKNLFKSVVIANRSENGGICRQRYCRQGAAFSTESADELGSQMLCVRCATAVSKEQKLATGSQASRNQGRSLHDRMRIIVADLHPQLCPFLKGCCNLG